MTCPTCEAEMAKMYKDVFFIWLCAQCGSATWEEGAAVYVPAWAKRYAEYELALRQIAAPDPHNPGWRQARARAALAPDEATP